MRENNTKGKYRTEKRNPERWEEFKEGRIEQKGERFRERKRSREMER